MRRKNTIINGAILLLFLDVVIMGDSRYTASMGILTQRFVAKVEAFLERHDISASSFGRDVVGDSKFVFALRDLNRSPTLDTVEKVEAYMRTHRGRSGRRHA
jgi:hypothetical protein